MIDFILNLFSMILLLNIKIKHVYNKAHYNLNKLKDREYLLVS